MAKEKKTPKKSDSGKFFSKDSEASLYGILIILISLIGLLNRGIVGEFMTYIFVYLFGAFYFVFFLFLIFFGGYLIIRKKVFHFYVDLKLFGFILLMLAFMISGSTDQQKIVFGNFFDIFNDRISQVSSSMFQISSVSSIPSLGGGLIGYFLKGTLNSAIDEIGTSIVIYLFFVLGLFFLFKDFVVSAFSFLSKQKEKRKKNKAQKSTLENGADSELETTPAVPSFDSVTKPEPIPYDDRLGSFTKVVEQTPKESVKQKPEINLNEAPLFKEVIKEEPVSTPKQNLNAADFFVNDLDDTYGKIDEEFSVKEEPVIAKPRLDPVVQNPNFNPEPISTPRVQEKEVSFEKPAKTSTSHEDRPKREYPYIYPPFNLLTERNDGDKTMQNIRVADDRVNRINELLSDLRIGANVISYTIGPSVTRFDVKTNPGVRVNTLASIQNEVAVKLGGLKTVRLEMVVEGKDTSGIEVGNEVVTTVSFKECLSAISNNVKDKLLIPLGKNISGKVISVSIDELPHLLVAGTTGSGKSVFIHSIIMSLIMRTTPKELKIMLIDPKKVEFAKYRGLPHLLCPIVTDTNEGKVAFQRLIDEMERRYELFAEQGQGATKYSEYIEVAEKNGLEKPPYIVVICDEFADFMSGHNAKEIEKQIQRIAQKARASGIYMIIATQRPSVGVITGDIKTNIPSRVALSVSSQIDSRIIVDETGAESLLGRGDMLVRIPTYKSLIRLQSSYVDNHEIYRVVEYLKNQAEPEYDPNFVDLTEKTEVGNGTGYTNRRTELDPLHEEVRRHVLETRIASTTNIQKNFGVGFGRADYILDCLEREGVVIRKSGNRREVVKELEDFE